MLSPRSFNSRAQAKPQRQMCACEEQVNALVENGLIDIRTHEDKNPAKTQFELSRQDGPVKKAL